MKLITTLSLIVIAFTIFSCSKKQDQPVTPVNNSIAFAGITEADSVKGNLSIQLASSGNQPTKVEVFANDSLIATVSKAPYSLTWNTLGVANGKYKVKAIAYYDGGKQTQIEVNVVVYNILFTIIIDSSVSRGFSDIMYIVTDSAGTVLNSVKYNGSDESIPIPALHPYLKNRLNVIEVRKDIRTYISAYLNVIRGSTWDVRGTRSNINPSFAATNISFTNVPAFSRITISSDSFGLTFNNLSSISTIKNYGLTPTGKQLIEYVDNNNNGYYGFFHVDTTQQAITMNLADSVFSPSLKRSVTISGATNLNLMVYGRSDLNYESYYSLDNLYNQQGSNLTYVYPDGSYLTDYKSYIRYEKSGWSYVNIYRTLPPLVVEPLPVTASITTNSINQFSFTSQGSFDYYSVSFYDAAVNSNIYVYSTSPNRSFKFPDILKLTDIPNASLSDFKIFSFSVFKIPGFDENKMPFYNPNQFSGSIIPSQSATLAIN